VGIVKIAVIQYDIAWLNRDANFEQLAPLVEEAVGNGARLVVLPEMFSTGFAMGSQWAEQLPEPFDGPSSKFLRETAVQYSIWITGSCAEIPKNPGADTRPANTLVLASPAGELSRYEKIHPFSYGGEDKWFRSGSHTLTVAIENVRVSFFICYDIRFGEHFWRLANETDVFVIPANWPESRREHWLNLLTARAIENQTYVIGCNRVGTGGGLSYVGDSRVIGPFGETVADAANNEGIIYAEITAQTVRETREKYPFLRDR